MPHGKRQPCHFHPFMQGASEVVLLIAPAVTKQQNLRAEMTKLW